MTEFPEKEEQMRCENYCATITCIRIGLVATALMLAPAILMPDNVPAYARATAAGCDAGLKRNLAACGRRRGGSTIACETRALDAHVRCMCRAAPVAGCAAVPGVARSPDITDPKKVPKGPGSVGTPPKSSTPGKPQGPGSVGTPPKSSPTPGVKPKGPGSVGSPPKSNSSSGGGGPILRSGNSGNSNSGGGNSGGSKR
jgi:hypothetical protein